MPRPSSRDRILDALETQLLEEGHASVTLDSVSHRAGVSKGGLTYHFSSKAALYEGFLDRLQERVDAWADDSPGDPGDAVRFYLTFEESEADDPYSPLWRSMDASMHAAEAGPGLTERIARIQDDLTRPLRVLDPLLAEHVRLVGNGMYMDKLLGTAAPDGAPHRAQLIDDLARAADRDAGT